MVEVEVEAVAELADVDVDVDEVEDVIAEVDDVVVVLEGCSTPTGWILMAWLKHGSSCVSVTSSTPSPQSVPATAMEPHWFGQVPMLFSLQSEGS